MIDPAKFTAFVLVTATTSAIPGPSMLFILGQAMWRGSRSGAVAVVGVELGYVVWWCLAALGLGTLALLFPLAFRGLAAAGALYLAWLGATAIRHSNAVTEEGAPSRALAKSRNAFRDGIVIALGNPKSLVYVVAILPPFVDSSSAVIPQIVLLASVAIAIDVILSAGYIFAGNRLAQLMNRPSTRVWLDRTVGLIFIAIAAGILVDQFVAGGR